MAEVAACLIVRNVIPQITSLSVAVILRFHRSVRGLEDELERIMGFLRDVHKTKDSKGGLKTLVAQMRDLAYEIQDRLDECKYREMIHHPITRIPFRCRIINEFRSLKSEMESIWERRRFHGLLEGSSHVSHDASENWPRLSGTFADLKPDDDIVGIDGKIQDLIGWMEDTEKPQRSVCSVVGMPGIGKTTLVTEAYNRKAVRGNFDCHAWITVSQSYKIDLQLRSMFEELCKSQGIVAPYLIHEMDYTYLVNYLREYLRQLRYVIVLDDLWNTDAWNEINAALPDNKRGSRVIVTTRMEHVARSLGSDSTVFRHERLSDGNDWKLFCNKAFANNANRNCPVELEPYARKLVDKCDGLPLDIVATGRLMLLKGQNAREWEKIVNSFSWVISNNPTLEKIKNQRLLSFNDLPYHLKYCFLYCSLFPENYIIMPKQIIRLWIAEGLIESRRERTFGGRHYLDEPRCTLEEDGKLYLDELVHRNMLEAKHTENFQMSKGFRLPKVMRELALSIAKEENFCMVYNSAEANAVGNARHLSIQNSLENISQRLKLSHLRALFLFTAEMTPSQLTTMMGKCRFLRVLSLENSSIRRVPDVSDLFNLRYLSLKNTKVERLPPSVGKLVNLETLDLRRTEIKGLPKGLKRMIRLRHVLVCRLNNENGCDYLDGFKAPKGIHKLAFLQTLTRVEADKDLIKDVGKLGQLRKFEIVKVRQEHGLQLCSSIENMKFLVSLHVMADKDETLDLESISSPPPFLQLQKLVLSGQLGKLPDWVACLADLTVLSLRWTRMRDDPISSLEALHKLENLTLWEAHGWQSLNFRAEKFVALKTLWISNLELLEEIKIEEGSMRCLQKLALTGCGSLKVLPKGIEYLNLNELIIDSKILELQKKVQGDVFPRNKNVKITTTETFMRCSARSIDRQIALSAPAEPVSNTEVEVPLQRRGHRSSPSTQTTIVELVSDTEMQVSPRCKGQALPLGEQTSHEKLVSFMDLQVPPRASWHESPLSRQTASMEPIFEMNVELPPIGNRSGLPPSRQAAPIELVSETKPAASPKGTGHGSPPSRRTSPEKPVSDLAIEVLPRGSGLGLSQNAQKKTVSGIKVQLPQRDSGQGLPSIAQTNSAEPIFDSKVKVPPEGDKDELFLSERTVHGEPVSDMKVQVPHAGDGLESPLYREVAPTEPNLDMEAQASPSGGRNESPLSRQTIPPELVFDTEVEVLPIGTGHGSHLSRKTNAAELVFDLNVEVPSRANGHGSPTSRQIAPPNVISDMKVDMISSGRKPGSPPNRKTASPSNQIAHAELGSDTKMKVLARGTEHGSSQHIENTPVEPIPDMEVKVPPRGTGHESPLSKQKAPTKPVSDTGVQVPMKSREHELPLPDGSSFETSWIIRNGTFKRGESSARRPVMPKWFIPPPLWTMQKDHLSNYGLNGQPLPKYQSGHAWRKVVNWYSDLSPIHKDVIARTPFASFFQIGDFCDNLGLVTALVERWRGETNTFHLPIGEVTITPLDFHLISGLPMSGNPVVFRDIPDDERILKLLGQVPPLEARQGKSIKHSWIFNTFHGRQASNTAEVLQNVRAFLWYTISGTFFASESAKAPLSLLELLAKLPNNTYDWGGAAYAFMLRGLRRISLSSATSIIAFPPIIEAWFYEYFPTHAPRLVSGEEWFPRLGRWNAANRATMTFTNDHDVARSQVDMLGLSKFECQPFINCLALQYEAGQEALRLSRSNTIFRCGKRLEWYLGSRVYRQWGDQVPGPNFFWPIPRDIPVPMPLNTISDLDFARVREMRINVDDDMLPAYLPYYKEWYQNNSLPQLLSISSRT